MESDHDAMSDSSGEEGFSYSPYEEAKPVPIVAPLPRRMLAWKFPGDQVLLDCHHHMKLAHDAPLVGLEGDMLKAHIVYGEHACSYTPPGQTGETGETEEAAAGQMAWGPQQADPSALFTLAVRTKRATVEADRGPDAHSTSTTPGSIDPVPWFRRSPSPEGSELPAGPRPKLPSMLCDDSGGLVRLPEPSEEMYFKAILMQQEDDEIAFKMNHCPQKINPRDVQDPFGLGTMVSWAPYFMDDMPDAGLFKPIKCLVGGTEQMPLPYVRYTQAGGLSRRSQSSDSVLPMLGVEKQQQHRLHQDIPMASVEVGEEEPLRRNGITLSEYTNATGRYKDWSRLLIGLEMSSAQQSRGYFETAATGLIIIVHFLARHMDEFGLLPGSEEHNSNIRVAQSEKKAFWRRVHDLARRVVHQQVISLEQLLHGRPDLIPNKVHSAETPLTGQPYRKPGMLPEDWWTYGREVDDEWIEFFSAHYWGGTSLESLMLVPVPAHACTGSNEDADDASRGCQSAQRPEMQRPLNIVSPYTMSSLKEVLDQMHWILHGTPNRPVVGSEDLFPLTEYLSLSNLVVRCCQDFRTLEKLSDDFSNLLPPSRYYNRQMLRYTGRSYKHPLEEFSV